MIIVTDNSGKSFDRYTVYINMDNTPSTYPYNVFTMSYNPLSPQGVNMFAGHYCLKPDKDNKEIDLIDLPKDVLVAIIYRLLDEMG